MPGRSRCSISTSPGKKAGEGAAVFQTMSLETGPVTGPTVKKCVAAFADVILRPGDGPVEVLVVRRSPNDRYFPNLWGLPAGTLRKREGYEQAIRRTAKHKLGIEVEV